MSAGKIQMLERHIRVMKCLQVRYRCLRDMSDGEISAGKIQMLERHIRVMKCLQVSLLIHNLQLNKLAKF